MLVAREFLGTLEDEQFATRVNVEPTVAVTVDDTDRRRSRVRTTSDDGTDVGIVVGRKLRDGDVLVAEPDDDDADEAETTLVVVSLEPTEVLSVDLGAVTGDAAAAATTSLELGHAVGNRHWDLAVEGTTAYFPLTEDRERMEEEVRPHLPDGATIGTDAVSPALFDDGQAGGHSHEDGDHSHPHDEGDHTHESVRSLDPAGGDRQ